MAEKYNIKQITGYDIKDNPTVTHDVLVPHRVKENDEWVITRTLDTVTYVTAIEGTEIPKFGYCCEPSAIIYPIFLQVDGEYKEFQIGKEGMYEFQPETFENVNEDEFEAETTTAVITGVQVPLGYNLTIDYAIPV